MHSISRIVPGQLRLCAIWGKLSRDSTLTHSSSMPTTRARSTTTRKVAASQVVDVSMTGIVSSLDALPATASKVPVLDLPVRAFPSATDFEAFLDAEHDSCPEFHLKLAKKSSGIPSVTAAEAVEVALCFGWIDGRANSLDDKFWLVRYTPRRAKSIWSQKNVNTIARLVGDDRMRPAGITAVEAAKGDGRWDRAYAGPATVVVPEDLQNKLKSEPAARAFFDGLNKSQRYSVLWRIETASPKARLGRIEALIQMLSVGQLPGDKSHEQQTTNAATKVITKSKKRAVVPSSRSKKRKLASSPGKD